MIRSDEVGSGVSQFQGNATQPTSSCGRFVRIAACGAAGAILAVGVAAGVAAIVAVAASAVFFLPVLAIIGAAVLGFAVGMACKAWSSRPVEQLHSNEQSIPDPRYPRYVQFLPPESPLSEQEEPARLPASVAENSERWKVESAKLDETDLVIEKKLADWEAEHPQPIESPPEPKELVFSYIPRQMTEWEHRWMEAQGPAFSLLNPVYRESLPKTSLDIEYEAMLKHEQSVKEFEASKKEVKPLLQGPQETSFDDLQADLSSLIVEINA